MSTIAHVRTERPVTITIAGAYIGAQLVVPDDACGLVVFAHGSAGSRNNPHTRQLARILNDASLATLVCDLLTEEEKLVDDITGEFRLDAALLSYRLIAVLDWCDSWPELRGLPVGLFGAAAGAAASIVAATARPSIVRALVLRSGRLDLAWSSLPMLHAPTLLVAGERDTPVRAGYEIAQPQMVHCEKEILVIPRAGHLFVEGTTREQLGEHAARWFAEHLNVTPGLGEALSEIC